MKPPRVAGVAVDLSSVTKIEIMFNGKYFDSDTYSSAFDWSGGEGVIDFSLGAIDLPVGKDSTTELIVYDPINPNGYIWATFIMEVIDLDTL